MLIFDAEKQLSDMRVYLHRDKEHYLYPFTDVCIALYVRRGLS